MKLFNKSALALTLLSSIASTKPTEILFGPKENFTSTTWTRITTTNDIEDFTAADVTHANSVAAGILGFLSNITGQTTNERVRRNAYAIAFLIPLAIITQKILRNELSHSYHSKTFQSVSPYCVAAAYVLGAILGRTGNYIGRITKPHIVSASKYVGNKALDAKNYIASKFHNN